MPHIVFVVVLSAALLHAAWNAIVKSASDKFLGTILVTAFAALISAAALPLLTGPARASWPYAAVSALFQIIYFVLVSRAYQVADMSQAYPLMRGTAPLLVAIVTVFQMGESLSPTGWLGVVAVCLGIFTMAAGVGTARRGVYFALLNAVVIAGYTLIDGTGVRLSGAPAAYTLWVFLLTGLPLTVWTIATKKATFIPYAVRYWRFGVAGGLATTVSYGLALWAMTLAPVAIVAALRETSILFAVVIAGLVLKEPLGLRRIIAACIIAGGAVALRLA